MLGRPLSAAVESPPASGVVRTVRSYGREPLLADVLELLASGRRVLTFTGPPGIGKSFLARALAPAVQAALGCAPVVVDTAAARTPAELARAVATALGARPPAGASDAVVSALVRSTLAARGPALLLVLDPLEHLAAAAAPLLAAWASVVRLVAVSRAVLHIPGEVVMEVGPLPEAEQLLLDRWRDARPGFQPGSADRRAAATLVARMEGVPLAIERCAEQLAAAPPALAVSAPLDAGELGLEHAIRRSWDLLGEAERRALCDSSVFRGGFTLAAAEHVLGPAAAAAGRTVLDLVQALRDASLLRVEDAPPGAPLRLGMYEILRCFAADRRAERGEQDQARRRHALFYAALAADSPEAHDLTVERANLAEILRTGGGLDVAERAVPVLRVAVTLAGMEEGAGIAPDMLAPVDQALSAPGVPSALLGRGLLVRALTRAATGQLSGAEDDARAALTRAVLLGDRALQAAARTALAAVLHQAGRAREALAEAAAAGELHRALGDPRGESAALRCEAELSLSQGRSARAAELYLDALARSRAPATPCCCEALAELGLGLHEIQRGRRAAARELIERALATATRAGAIRAAARARHLLALCELIEGAPAAAARILEGAAATACAAGAGELAGSLLAVEAAALAEAGADLDEADALRAEAERSLAAHPAALAVARVLGAVVDLARARSDRVAGDPAAAARLQDAARSRVLAGRAAPRRAAHHLQEGSVEARLVLDLAERALRDAAPSPSTELPPSAPELVIPDDARWFRLDGAPSVDLSGRDVLRRILAALRDRRRDAAGTPLSFEELVGAGWPGEIVERRAAQNRLYVAISKLRSLGLRDVLVHGPEGYCLRADIPLRRLGE